MSHVLSEFWIRIWTTNTYALPNHKYDFDFLILTFCLIEREIQTVVYANQGITFICTDENTSVTCPNE